MENLLQEIIKKKLFSWKRIWLPTVLAIVFLGMILVGLIAYEKTYQDRVLPGVHIGDISVAGMTRGELLEYLNSMNEKLSKRGLQFRFTLDGNEHVFTILPSVVTGDRIVDLVVMDTDKEADRLISYNKRGNVFVRAWQTGVSRVVGPSLKIENITIDSERLLSEIKTKIEPFEQPAREVGVRIDTILPVTYTITTSSPGVVFDYDGLAELVLNDRSVLRGSEIEIIPTVKNPTIQKEAVEKIANRIEPILAQGGLSIGYTDSYSKRKYSWPISKQDIANWMEMQTAPQNSQAQTDAENETQFVFGLNKEKVVAFLGATVAPDVNREARNAKFSVGANNKVKEFQGSRPGVSLDVKATYDAINSGFLERMLHDEGTPREIVAVTSQVEPEINTGEVNDLGIQEILGVGYSNFKGSPTNRIKNIRFAIEQKLNGLLIKPDEEFSLLNALKPFTIEGGYLPELVIKGDEIKPEVAGGLCQIGTTMFRAAMNTGLPITSRANHSLVVNYYNDHRNNLPGTDATIYEPAPDFRFKNDTGHYLLLTTEIDMTKKDIYFTLWGTGDGRKGSYGAPIVSKWLPTGPTQIIETTDLPVGQKKCQSRHPGANASFTYTRELPSGEKIDRVFESYYRPLPEICLVGVAEKTQENVPIPDFIAEDLGLTIDEE